MSTVFHSLRWRLQLWHGAILLLAVIAFCLTAYRLAWDNQLQHLDKSIGRTEWATFHSLMVACRSEGSRKAAASPERVVEPLRAGPLDAFWHVALPLARPGYLTGAVMGFAHTLGEFGVVLMIGGNIPDKTRVVSVAIYDHVEALEYAQAHWLSGGMLAFSFVVLLVLYGRRGNAGGGVG